MFAKGKAMSGKEMKTDNVNAIVATADDMEDAEALVVLLKEDGIPAFLGEETDGEPSGIPVMAPEECLDEAMVIIEARRAFDDFYGFEPTEGVDLPEDEEFVV